MNDVIDPIKDVIGGRGSWHGGGAGGPHDGVRNVLCLSVHSPYSVAVIRVQGWAKVPAVNAMGCPTVAYAGFSWMMMQVPGGAMGVQLKSKGPWSCVQADR